MFAPLPASLDNGGRADTHMHLIVGDDLVEDAPQIDDITLRLILHDSDWGHPIEILNSSEKPDPPSDDHIERALISLFKNINHLYNHPPRKGIEKRLEVRINNFLLEAPAIEDGWLVFRDIDSNLFALGKNLIGVRVAGRSTEARQPLTIEKFELHVNYR